MILLHFFYQITNLFLYQSYLKSPQINLIKNAKNHFLLLKRFKKTEVPSSAEDEIHSHLVRVSILSVWMTFGFSLNLI